MSRFIKKEKTRLFSKVIETTWWQREAFEEWAVSRLAKTVGLPAWKMRMMLARDEEGLVKVELG
jgi:hypothetical protein